MNLLKKNRPIFIIVSTCLMTIVPAAFSVSAGEKQTNNRHPRLIAHAGGDYKGVPMTNSLQALECSVREGYRYIEVDMCKAGDGVIMLVHDWEHLKTMVNVPLNNNIPAYKEIVKAEKSHTLIDLNRFVKWMKKYKDVFIITDIKENNLDILRYLKEHYPEMHHRFIPQVYAFDEYPAVKEMGYENIVLTLYKVKESDDDIVAFCIKNPLFALTISAKRAANGFLQKCSAIPVPVYVHTVNDIFEYRKLRSSGVHGVYTDFFQPDTWIEE